MPEEVLFTKEEIKRIERKPEPIGAILQDLIIETNYERLKGEENYKQADC